MCVCVCVKDAIENLRNTEKHSVILNGNHLIYKNDSFPEC